MKIKNVTYSEGYNPMEDEMKGVFTIHLEHDKLFGIGIDYVIREDKKPSKIKFAFIPKNVDDLGKDEF